MALVGEYSRSPRQAYLLDFRFPWGLPISLRVVDRRDSIRQLRPRAVDRLSIGGPYAQPTSRCQQMGVNVANTASHQSVSFDEQEHLFFGGHGGYR